MKVRKALVVGGLVMGLVVPAACGGQQAAQRVGDAASAPSRDAFRVGESVKLGDQQLTIHGFKDPFTSDRVQAKAADGSRLISVDAEVKNLATDPRDVSGFAQFEVKDADGKTFGPSSKNVGLPALGGQTAPGASQRGTVIFEVPNGSTGLTVVFKNVLYGSGSAEVALA